MPEIDYKPFENTEQVKGVFLQGCVERGDGSWFRRQAHAHTSGPYKGWICVLSPKRLYASTGCTSQLMLHELAHILTGHGHDDVWRAKARELGYRVRKHEQKRTRV